MGFFLKFSACRVSLFLTVLCFSCNNAGETKKTPVPAPVTTKKTEKKPAEPDKSQRPPIINIADTLAPKRTVAVCKDTAALETGVQAKAMAIYATKLKDFMKINGIKDECPVLCWYQKQKKMYNLHAGIILSKKTTKTTKGIELTQINAGKVVVAHFYGPYSLLPTGYQTIEDWIKENKRTKAGTPYEIYITAPVDKNGKSVDPYKVQTDIVFPVK